MHAGSGFHNKLNLTSSKESCLRQDDVIYYLFIVWIFVAVFHKKPDRFVAPNANNLLVYGFISWIYGEAVRSEMLWIILTFPSDICA